MKDPEIPLHLLNKIRQNGQDHVLQTWDQLSAEDKANLIAQWEEIDWESLAELTGRPLTESTKLDLAAGELQPAPYISWPEDEMAKERWEGAAKLGEDLCRQGQVACFTVAGGQGTRLGFDGPKGTFPISPVRKHSLFQIFAEKILAARKRYEASIPWFIMTSHLNHEDTVSFFREHGFFGLPEADVYFFRQGRMPAVDPQGRLILADRANLALSPDGHGGCLRALSQSGSLEEMKKRGIRVISYFQVDNPLIEIIDTAFLGFHAQSGSEMSSRMIPKRDALEKVGNFCVYEGKTMVIEYSDMPEELAQQTGEDGRLRFTAGSIAIHLLDVAFAERMALGSNLPFHQAHKKIPYLDESGKVISPEEPNGYKFEKFIFDALPHAAHPLILETRREDQFSPVKNATGQDSVETCVRDQVQLFLRWLEEAGATLPAASREKSFRIEISPLMASNGQELKEAWQSLHPKPELIDGLVLS